MSGLLRLQGETAAELREMLLSWYVAALSARVFATVEEAQGIVVSVLGPPGGARLDWQISRTADPALPVGDPLPSDAVERAHRRLHGGAELDPESLQTALHALATSEARPWAIVRRRPIVPFQPSVEIEQVAEPVRPDLPRPPLLALPVPLTLGEASLALRRAGDWQYTVGMLRDAVELLAGRRPQLEPSIDPHLEYGETELRRRSEERW